MNGLTMNTTPTTDAFTLTTVPKTVTTSPLIRQPAMESALSDALHLVRTTSTQQGIHAATGRANRAASLLKQTCDEFQNGGAQ